MTAADSKIKSGGSSADTGIEDRKTVQPRAFVSYSWSSLEHQERIRSWADRLMGDGVDVVLDVYDLKEGSDKYAFMERMVTDPTVSHVLVFCDREYARKADDRSAGVGVESQIISKEIYDKVEQSTFIPIVCEFDEAEEATLPAFMKSRIWIDFSSEEKANASWERLIRLLYGRPQHAKPPVGSRPKISRGGRRGGKRIDTRPVPITGDSCAWRKSRRRRSAVGLTGCVHGIRR